MSNGQTDGADRWEAKCPLFWNQCEDPVEGIGTPTGCHVLESLKTGTLLAVLTECFPTLPGYQVLLSMCMGGTGEGAVDTSFEVVEVPVR